MIYTFDEEWRDNNWYKQAGESMQKKANYLRLGIYELSRILEDPEKNIPWHAKKDMIAERAGLERALNTIYDTYNIRCSDLKSHPTFLKSFQDGFLGQ